MTCLNKSAAWRNCSANADFWKSPRRTLTDFSSGGRWRTFLGLFRGGSSANPPRIRPGPRRTAAELIYSAESAADSASEIFIPPKKFFVGFRLGGDRTHSDFLGLSRTESESAAELFRQLYYRSVRYVFVGGHFSSELFRQFAAESARIRPYPRGVRRCPPNVRRTFGGVRRKIFLADVRRIRAEPGGVRAFPCGFGRNRGGRSSAEPIAHYCAEFIEVTTLEFKEIYRNKIMLLPQFNVTPHVSILWLPKVGFVC